MEKENFILKEDIEEVIRSRYGFQEIMWKVSEPYIDKIDSSNDRKEIKRYLQKIIDELKENQIQIDYNNPTIWTNYGIDSINYTGSGEHSSLKHGYASILSKAKVNTNKYTPLNLITYIIRVITKHKLNSKSKHSDFWNKIIYSHKKRLYDMTFFEELWIDNMPIEKLKNLKILIQSNNYSFKRGSFQSQLNTSITTNLLIYTFKKAAEYNKQLDKKAEELGVEVDENEKIYFENTALDGNIFFTIPDELEVEEENLRYVPEEIHESINLLESKLKSIRPDFDLKSFNKEFTLKYSIKDIIKEIETENHKLNIPEEREGYVFTKFLNEYYQFLEGENKETGDNEEKHIAEQKEGHDKIEQKSPEIDSISEIQEIKTASEENSEQMPLKQTKPEIIIPEQGKGRSRSW